MRKQTLRALNWQNRELDKKTKAISETCETASRIELNISMLKELETQQSTNPSVISTVVNDTANILHLLGCQSKPQLNLNLKDLAKMECVMNGV